MIFAEMDYPQDYSAIHKELDDFIRTNFQNVQSGIQCDSWFWITEGQDKVALDTFSSMKHQVKSATPDNPLVPKVIDALRSKYVVRVYSQPELEAHEGD